jgi:hypothetical protein
MSRTAKDSGDRDLGIITHESRGSVVGSLHRRVRPDRLPARLGSLRTAPPEPQSLGRPTEPDAGGLEP